MNETDNITVTAPELPMADGENALQTHQNNAPESGAGEQEEPKDEEIEAMMRSGIHFGHAKTKDHPAMKPYIFGVRNTVSIIDLVRTK